MRHNSEDCGVPGYSTSICIVRREATPALDVAILVMFTGLPRGNNSTLSLTLVGEKLVF